MAVYHRNIWMIADLTCSWKTEQKSMKSMKVVSRNHIVTSKKHEIRCRRQVVTPRAPTGNLKSDYIRIIFQKKYPSR